jgi:hypothetical protein
VNKKLNTALFFVVATALNIALVMVLALALFVPYALWIAPLVPPPANLIALVVVVVGSMAGSFPIYRRLVDWFQKKVDVEKYFDPIVKSSGKSRRR